MSAPPTPPASLWQRLVLWLGFGPATDPGPSSAEQPAGEVERKSVHDVTLEQLGIAHWTVHTLF